MGTLSSGEWDERYGATPLVWSAGPNQFVEAEVAGLAPGRAVDLATGEGRNAIWLAGRGWRVTGVDFSPVALSKARDLAEAAGVDVDWVLADLTAYRPEPAAFDLVLVAYLHLAPDERRGVVAAAAAAVAPGGTFLLVGHDLDNLTRGHGGPQDPERLWTVEAAVDGLAGLDVERAEQVVRLVATDDGQVEAIDTLVRARRP